MDLRPHTVGGLRALCFMFRVRCLLLDFVFAFAVLPPRLPSFTSTTKEKAAARVSETVRQNRPESDDFRWHLTSLSRRKPRRTSVTPLFRITQKALLSTFVAINKRNADISPFLQVRNYAARKGTRAKKESKKVKKVVEKTEFVPHNIRKKEKMMQSRPSRKFDDSNQRTTDDNVYTLKYFKWKVYPFAEAVQCHRETHHPDMYNVPDAKLHVNVELNMQGPKQTKLIDSFSRIAPMPHKFDHGEERTIIAFCKDPDLQKEVQNAGAQLAGGLDLIKQIQNGAISLQDFQFVLAHPDILPELVSLKGLLKRRFPNIKMETLTTDLTGAVMKFTDGLSYRAVADEYEKDFGIVETFIGTLNMDVQHLEENFASLIQDINKMRPKREGPFITRCLLLSPPSREKFKVDHNKYIEEAETKEVDGDDEEEEQQQQETVVL